MELIRFFNPELSYLDDSSLLEKVRKEDRIMLQESVTKDVLSPYCNGFSFDWPWYVYYNKLNLSSYTKALNHFIKEGYFMNLPTCKEMLPKEGSFIPDFGVNFFSFDDSPGTMPHAVIQSLLLINIPCISIVIPSKILPKNIPLSLLRSKYLINVIAISPERADILVLLRRILPRRRNVAFWKTMDTMPLYWKKYMSWFDEIWTCSNFSLNFLSVHSPVPVVNIRPPLELPSFPDLSTDSPLVQGDGPFFLTSFDGRKFPSFAVQSLVRAKQLLPSDIGTFIIKTRDLPKTEEASLRLRGFEVINKHLPYSEYISLFNSINIFISPHRSIFQGRDILLAMLLSKKVIATGYSGNMDYCTVTNSYLVKCSETETEPSIQSLAKLINRAAEDYKDGKSSMNAQAMKKVSVEYNYKKCSELLKERLPTS